MKKGSGVLLHISSLQGYGIGGFGKYAFAFVDKLKKAGFGYWQILPLNPTSLESGNSPYSSTSLFAGNRYFLDLDEFAKYGWLNEADLKIKSTGKVDFAAVDKHRKSVLKKAFDNADGETKQKAKNWAKKHKNIYIYAVYSALRDKLKKPWNEWQDGLKNFEPSEVKSAEEKYAEEISRYIFEQYFFFKQAKKLKEYANKNGIEIIGDFPVYASFDSADVWANQNLFELENFSTKLGAGVPPDYFSSTGQLWGNPVYKIEEHKKDGYKWMLDRFETASLLCDVLRVDHFRGYESFWAVAAGEETAVNGIWIKGFGKELFDKVKERTDIGIIAEDLGIITEQVNLLKEELDFPGMNVLQFAYGDWDSKYLPIHHQENSVSYIGTHDNDTLVGWLNNATGFELDNIKNKTGYDGNYKIFFEELMSSKSNVVIFTMQDMLGLDGSYRMNVPSVAEGNWDYQMKDGQFDDDLINYFAQLNARYGR